jgi:hypothetical protein
MDDDPVLRSLGDDLARDDPRLAALLSGAAAPHRRWGVGATIALLLLLPVLLAVALLVPPTVALGAIALTLALGSPLAVCWLCAVADRTTPRTY